MKILLWGLAAGLAVAAVARADPLEKDQVSGSARWVVHIDTDAFRSAGHAQKIAGRWLNRGPVEKQLAWLNEQIGFDPAKDLHSITFYGTRAEFDRGVSIVRATVDRKRLLAYLKEQPGYKTDSHGTHRLHVFQTPATEHRGEHRGEQRGERQQQNVVACLYQPAVIVFGRNVDQLTAALDLLDRKAPGLAADSPLVKDIPQGTILWLGSTGLAESQPAFKSSFARHSKQLLLALGEHDNNVFLEATLLTDSEEHAAQMRQAVEKFQAFARQQQGGGESIKKLFQTLEVSGAGQTVNVQWRAPGEHVAKLFEGFPRSMPSHADSQRRQEEFKKRLLERYDKNGNGEIDDDEREAMRAEWAKRMDQRKAEWSKRMEEHKKRKSDR